MGCKELKGHVWVMGSIPQPTARNRSILRGYKFNKVSGISHRLMEFLGIKSTDWLPIVFKQPSCHGSVTIKDP